jgi:hypothetical protein
MDHSTLFIIIYLIFFIRIFFYNKKFHYLIYKPKNDEIDIYISSHFTQLNYEMLFLIINRNYIQIKFNLI